VVGDKVLMNWRVYENINIKIGVFVRGPDFLLYLAK